MASEDSEPPTRPTSVLRTAYGDESEGDWEHFSSALPTGSRIFIVQGKKFIIPKALLVRHSVIFAGIDQDIESLDPIVLEDSAEAFRDFVDHIYDPFESPLHQPNPSLKRVLNILQIANKYCVEKLEKRAESIAQQLTEPSILRSHLSERLTHIDVFRIGSTLQNDLMARNGWNLITEDFRADKLSARTLLDEAGESRHPHFLISAYYQIMLRGARSWENNQELSGVERQRLTHGFVRCCEEWEAFASQVSAGRIKVNESDVYDDWEDTMDGSWPPEDRGFPMPSLRWRSAIISARNPYDIIVKVMVRLRTENGLRFWDIIGRLTALVNLQPHKSCTGLGEFAKETLSDVEARLASFFLLDDHNALWKVNRTEIPD